MEKPHRDMDCQGESLTIWFDRRPLSEILDTIRDSWDGFAYELFDDGGEIAIAFFPIGTRRRSSPLSETIDCSSMTSVRFEDVVAACDESVVFSNNRSMTEFGVPGGGLFVGGTDPETGETFINLPIEAYEIAGQDRVDISDLERVSAREALHITLLRLPHDNIGFHTRWLRDLRARTLQSLSEDSRVLETVFGLDRQLPEVLVIALDHSGPAPTRSVRAADFYGGRRVGHRWASGEQTVE
jgi:hypothetical protein